MQSTAGHGSTFWVELPLGVGSRVLERADDHGVSLIKPMTTVSSMGTASASHLSGRSASALHTIMNQGEYHHKYRLLKGVMYI